MTDRSPVRYGAYKSVSDRYGFRVGKTEYKVRGHFVYGSLQDLLTLVFRADDRTLKVFRGASGGALLLEIPRDHSAFQKPSPFCLEPPPRFVQAFWSAVLIRLLLTPGWYNLRPSKRMVDFEKDPRRVRLRDLVLDGELWQDPNVRAAGVFFNPRN